MRICETCGGPIPTPLGHGFDACIRYLATTLRKMREAKAVPPCCPRCEAYPAPPDMPYATPPAPPFWECRDCHHKCDVKHNTMHTNCGSGGTHLMMEVCHDPTAPPFVLGPKTRNALCAINTLDGTFHVARETARLIAEWLLAKSANEAVHAWADRILRGDWGKK